MSKHHVSRPIAAMCLVMSLALAAGCTSSASSSSGAAVGRGSDPGVRPVVRINPETKVLASRTGEVYLLRGLMDIFSAGMDEMAAKFNRAGVHAVSVNHSAWQSLADDILARSERGEISYPVIIMGHSLGGNDAPKMASFLGERGVKVSYVVTFDPTEPGYVGKNIAKVVNYYLPNGDNRVRKRAGFSGKLDNISMAGRDDITHVTIEKNHSLQARVISYVMGITKKKKS